MTEPTRPPDSAFATLGLRQELLRGIHELGFIRPTPIQEQAIPPILEGRDVIGIAQTGTGKTAAFVLPILDRLLRGTSGPHVRALLISPTRELALQSIEHMKALSRYVPLKGAAIFGGVPMPPQISALARGVDIISATPGRLLDHVYSGRIDFGALNVFVLDEVDRMLDMGFLPDVRQIISLLPRKRQNLVFSATLPPEIVGLVHEILHDPVTIRIVPRTTAAVGIRHAIYPVPRHRKADFLLELLRGSEMTSVLVFTRTKHMADRLTRILKQRNIRVSVLHGGRSQSQRLHALDQFRRRRSQVMLATDIAARGIDIEDITHVINYDVPATPEDYVHRIGRTARVDATGDAFTLVDRDEEPQIRAIEKTLQRTLPRITLPHFNYHAPPPHAPAHRPGRPHHGQRRFHRR